MPSLPYYDEIINPLTTSFTSIAFPVGHAFLRNDEGAGGQLIYWSLDGTTTSGKLYPQETKDFSLFLSRVLWLKGSNPHYRFFIE